MTKTIAHIGNFFAVTPAVYTQNEILDWTMRYVVASNTEINTDALKARFERYAIQSEKIASRGFECAQIKPDGNERQKQLYKIKEATGTGPLLEVRSAFFLEKTNEVVERLYAMDNRVPDHIVHVTCTGYVSPSAPQRYVVKKLWDTEITHAYHMGCYASLPSVRIAAASVALNKQTGKTHNVDVLHTEICSLHFNPKLDSPEQTVVQSLFADGHIKYTVATPDSMNKGFSLHAIKEKIIPNSADQMTWQPEHFGFRMTLGKRFSNTVPFI